MRCRITLCVIMGMEKTDIAAALLAWYDRHARRLPWRALPGEIADPYHVWLSEIMLQQTTVATVKSYFEKFLGLWPRVEDLAAASQDDVLTAWAGLGYYARARNLHKCAGIIAQDHGGRFPDTEEGLRELPGIGRYTAAAVAAIAFGRRAVVMDGNIERVAARLNAIETPLPDAKPALYELVDAMTPDQRAGDFAQAMMDLGATVCTPGRPKCMLCPIAEACMGQGIAETLPRKKPKKAKPTRRGTVFWLERPDGSVFLRRRAESGLLGGMMEFPSTDWAEEGAADTTLGAGIGEVSGRILDAGEIRHTFTHFHLILKVRAILVSEDWRSTEGTLKDPVWVNPDGLGGHALPTVMRKVATAALKIREPAE